MNKIKKYLAKLDSGRRERLLAVLRQIENGDLSGLNIKKLGGFINLYRVRVEDSRIKFTMDENGIRIVYVGKKDDTTYNF